MSSPAPIALFVYDRPTHTQLALESLSRCPEAVSSHLYVFSDGPRKPADRTRVDDVREVVTSRAWCAEVSLVERQQNLGLAGNITSGVSQVVEQHGVVVVLEDDLVLSPHFLRYMNDALRLYRDEDDVISIHGWVPPVKRPLPETFFIRGADCWGWATWASGWQHFEPDGALLMEALKRQKLVREFNFGESFDYFKMLRQQVEGRIDSWAIRWYAAAFLKKKLTLYPGRSLVRNLGLDGSGVHCEITTRYDVELSTSPIQVRPIDRREEPRHRAALASYFRSVRPGLRSRIRGSIRKIAGR